MKGHLDYGDKLMHHMKSPILHFFSNDNAPATNHAHKHPNVSSHDTKMVPQSVIRGSEPTTTTTAEMSDVERLTLLLGELEQQATLMNEEAIRGTKQIEHITEGLSIVNDRVQAQTKAAKSIIDQS
jgi:hypothetical protein